MPGRTGSNSSGGRPPIDKVRQLQRRLWVAAKRSPERRFHALRDRIWRRDVLQAAWWRVKKNRGAAGVDRETLADVEQYGVERMLDELHVALRAGTYRPPPVLRRYIPKADGRQRPLGIPTVRDRVAQMATTIVLEPIFEADFRSSLRRIRTRVRELTPRARCHEDLRAVIADLNRVLRGWGQYFRTGNAATTFQHIDRHVEDRLRGLLLKRAGSRRVPRRADQWRRPFFEALGLIRLRGTIQYPGVAHATT
jgi:hypothetical protein